MVNDFLKKYQEELISDRIQIKEDLDLLETKIKEEKKFLDLLEESNESYFKEFTPRNINSKNNKKAEEIRQYLSELNLQLENKSNQLKFYDGRLVELNALISNTAVINRPGDSSINPSENDVSNNNISQNVDSIQLSDRKNLKATLLTLKDLILLDPYRAQIELEKIISTI